MGVDISTPGANAFTPPPPLVNFICPVEKWEMVNNVYDGPVGDISIMRDPENDTKFIVQTFYIDMGRFESANKFMMELHHLSQSYFPTNLTFVGFTISNPFKSRKPAFVYETYSDGTLGDLFESVAQGKSPKEWDITMKIKCALSIAISLDYIHNFGYVHGAVTPDNIVMQENLRPNLANFSFQYLLDEKMAAALVPNKPRLWRAPELTLETDRTKAGDIFAYGVLLLQMFISPEDFDKINSNEEIIQRIQSGQRPKISTEVPQEIRNIIQRCWMQDPALRPTAGEVVGLFQESVGAIAGASIQELETFREEISASSNDVEKARQALLAAECGDSSMQNNFGVMCLNGRGVRKNITTAARYFQMSADRGCVEGIYNCGFALENGAGVKKNVSAAALYFKAAADKGFKNAQCSYAQLLVKGSGVEKNYEEAAKYFKLAASQGSPSAQYRLGLLHETGDGVTKSDVDALKCYRAAAALKFPPAMYRLAYLMISGRTQEKSMAEAFKSIAASAQMGYPRSMALLGAMSWAGEGAAKSPETARKQLEGADKKGEPAGTFGLAVIEASCGDARGLELLKAAAEKGYADAERVMAILTQDDEEKKKLTESAESGGLEKERVLPLRMILKGTKADKPTVEACADLFKGLSDKK